MEKAEICHWPSNKSVVRVRHSSPSLELSLGFVSLSPIISPDSHSSASEFHNNSTEVWEVRENFIAQLFHPAAAEIVSSPFTGHDSCNKKLSVIEVPSPKSVILIVQVQTRCHCFPGALSSFLSHPPSLPKSIISAGPPLPGQAHNH